MNTPICDFVRQYAASNVARLHMPGHKGTPVLGAEPWDITEIDGADSLYEAVSALATVGLTAGTTGQLSVASKLLIILYMYFGRVGVLTLSLGFLMGNRAQERLHYAQTDLMIG